MLKILHCADLHLDTPFTDSLQKGEARRAKLRSAFTNLTRFVREKQVDIVLMAGDLFDSEYATKDTAELLCREMASIPDCRFFISPGNHDPYTEKSVYACTEFPQNVTVFSSENPSSVDLSELGVTVYGYAFEQTTMARAPMARISAENKNRINLLCAHADLSSPLSPYAPTTKEALAGTGMDYIALGHIHACSGLDKIGDTYYAYCGCLEGRGFDELGYKGALYLEMEKENGILSLQASEKVFSFGRYEIARVDLTGARTEEEALMTIRTYLKDNKLLGADTTLRLILCGIISPKITRLERDCSAMLESLVYALEIKDTTSPLLDSDTLLSDVSIRGAFYRQLLPDLQSEDEQIRARAVRALHLGLAALADEAVVKDFGSC